MLTYGCYLTPVSPLRTERQHKRLKEDRREQLTQHVLLFHSSFAIYFAICGFAALLCFGCLCCLDILFCFIPL